MKFPIQDFPIRGGILTPAKRAAAIRNAIAKLKAQGEYPPKTPIGWSGVRVVAASAKKR